jgi:uncharacterized membrane protein HdeD (DUF308 family)
MTNSRPGEFVALVGTLTIFTGATILAVSWATSSIPALFVGALFVFGGLLLRIEAAVLRSSKVLATNG